MIHFNNLDVPIPNFLDENSKLWIENIIEHYFKKTGEVFFLFCSDEYLYQMNVKYLSHTTYTDIITFDTSEEISIISGELYISLERVQENASQLGESFRKELYRVLAHGVLHLLGFNDKTEAESAEMRLQENICLSLPSGNI